MPTTIDIEITDFGESDYDGCPYPGRVYVTYRLISSIKPASFYEHHLGFRAAIAGKPKVKQRENKYSIHCTLEPFGHSAMRISPFNLILSNEGDGQLRVSVRLPRSMQYVMLVALRDGVQIWQAKPYQHLDESIYYATLVFDALMTIHIEELQDGYATQPLAEEEGDSI